MPIDIKSLTDQLFNDYKSSILTEVANDAPDIVAAANSYIVQGEQRFKDLALGILNKELTYDFVILRLREETITLKDTLIGLEQMAASDISSLVDKLIAIFESLLKTSIFNLNPISVL